MRPARWRAGARGSAARAAGRLVEAHPELGAEAAELLAPGRAVTRRTTPGGAGPDPVAEQLERFARRLDNDAERIGPEGEGR